MRSHSSKAVVTSRKSHSQHEFGVRHGQFLTEANKWAEYKGSVGALDRVKGMVGWYEAEQACWEEDFRLGPVEEVTVEEFGEEADDPVSAWVLLIVVGE
jgi:hypothetical protein